MWLCCSLIPIVLFADTNKDHKDPVVRTATCGCVVLLIPIKIMHASEDCYTM